LHKSEKELTELKAKNRQNVKENIINKTRPFYHKT